MKIRCKKPCLGFIKDKYYEIIDINYRKIIIVIVNKEKYNISLNRIDGLLFGGISFEDESGSEILVRVSLPFIKIKSGNKLHEFCTKSKEDIIKDTLPEFKKTIDPDHFFYNLVSMAKEFFDYKQVAREMTIDNLLK